MREAFGAPMRIGAEGMLLIILSAIDLLVTHRLLRQNSLAYESNPIAQWFFARWNIIGMIAFKFSLIAFVFIVGEVIERHRPGVGRAIVLLGCAGAVYAISQGLRILFA